jgi:hypothetical protein
VLLLGTPTIPAMFMTQLIPTGRPLRRRLASVAHTTSMELGSLIPIAIPTSSNIRRNSQGIMPIRGNIPRKTIINKDIRHRATIRINSSIRSPRGATIPISVNGKINNMNVPAVAFNLGNRWRVRAVPPGTKLGLHRPRNQATRQPTLYSAAYVLATYLDFRMPDMQDKDREQRQHMDRIPWLGEKYPAADALFEIGKPASPILVRVVGETSISLLRDNALEVLLAIHSEDMADAVTMLNQASRSALDPATSIRLLDAARKEAAKCPSDLRNRCEGVLLEQNRD